MRWPTICHREGGGADRCRGRRRASMTNTRLTVQHGCSRPQPCAGMSLGSPLPPRHRGRGALGDLGDSLSSGGRRRRCRGLRRAPGCKYSPHSPRWRLTRPAVLWCVAWVASAARVCLSQISARRQQPTPNPNPNPNPNPTNPNPNPTNLEHHSPRARVDGPLVPPFRPEAARS